MTDNNITSKKKATSSSTETTTTTTTTTTASSTKNGSADTTTTTTKPCNGVTTSSSSTKEATTTTTTTTPPSSSASKATTTATSTPVTTTTTITIPLPSIRLIMILVIGSMIFIPPIATMIHFYDRHLWFQDGTKYTVDRMHTNTTFIRRDIPITYYRRGELHKVLPKDGWINDVGDDGMRVFRLYPDEEPFEIDIKQIQTTLRVKEVMEDCPNIHGWIYCANTSCQKEGAQIISGNAQDILLSNSSTLYGSFAVIDDNVVNYLLSTLKLPFTLDRGSFEQSFISNFKNRLLTTQIHANPATHSLAVQYAGRKTWLFITAEDYLKKDGFHSTSINGPFVPLKAPTTEKMIYWVYKSQPGDLFYFPPFYGHTVVTEPGPNVMLNFRKPFPHQTLTRPVSFFHALFNIKFLSIPADAVKVTPDGKEWDHQNKDEGSNIRGPKVVGGTSLIMRQYMDTFGGLGCDDDNSHTNMDTIFAKLVNQAAESIP